MVEKRYFEDFVDIVQEVYETAIDEGKDVTVVGDYEFIEYFFQLLIACDRTSEGLLNILYFELASPEFEGYEGPYLFQLTSMCDVYCEKMVRQNNDGTVILDISEDEDRVYVQKKFVDVVKEQTEEDVPIIVVTNDFDKCDEEDSDAGHLNILTEDNKISGFVFNRDADGIKFNVEMHGDVSDSDKFAKLVANIIEEYTTYIKK